MHRARYSNNNIDVGVYSILSLPLPTKHVCKLYEISQSFVSNILEVFGERHRGVPEGFSRVFSKPLFQLDRIYPNHKKSTSVVFVKNKRADVRDAKFSLNGTILNAFGYNFVSLWH